MKHLSVFESDGDLLTAFSDIFLNGTVFDLDCTYSKGIFYQKINPPTMKSDLIPLCHDVIKSDCRELNFIKNESLNSIVFDPRFCLEIEKAKTTIKFRQDFHILNLMTN